MTNNHWHEQGSGVKFYYTTSHLADRFRRHWVRVIHVVQNDFCACRIFCTEGYKLLFIGKLHLNYQPF